MDQMTLWGVSELLRTFLGGASSRPNNFYLAVILEDAPTAFTAGEGLDEPGVELGYSRLVIPNTTDFWQPQGLDTISLSRDVSFAPATADWGLVRYWALTNSEVDGDVYMIGQLSEPIEILATDELEFPAQMISLSIPVLLEAEDG